MTTNTLLQLFVVVVAANKKKVRKSTLVIFPCGQQKVTIINIHASTEMATMPRLVGYKEAEAGTGNQT